MLITISGVNVPFLRSADEEGVAWRDQQTTYRLKRLQY
jgi:hypothetical protein